jgi:tRNA(His) guanylyltransferase
MKDALGDRMKDQYESRYKIKLPRRTYTIVRLDGKAFHTFTKGMKKPFDEKLSKTMRVTTAALCAEIQGCQIGYTQSDEISLLLTDFKNDQTTAFFDGNIQKIASVSASIATAIFNDELDGYVDRLAYFDSRVFVIPDPTEVENYFIWRQQDCVRNSISMLAQSLYSHKELHGVNTNEMQELCFQKGHNWNDVEDGYKRGFLSVKELYEIESEQGKSIRSRWKVDGSFDFLKDRDALASLIPKYDK